jgi:hypothetical protein
VGGQRASWVPRTDIARLGDYAQPLRALMLTPSLYTCNPHGASGGSWPPAIIVKQKDIGGTTLKWSAAVHTPSCYSKF